MKLTLLGTGCPSVDHKRFGPSNLVTTNSAKILIDCGSGITQRLHQLKVSTANIDALLFTHLHSDHAVDFYQLIISSWHSYRIKPWKIYGPKGTKKFVRKIMDAWADERKARISYEARASAKAFQIDVIEFKSLGEIKVKDLTIKYFELMSFSLRMVRIMRVLSFLPIAETKLNLKLLFSNALESPKATLKATPPGFSFIKPGQSFPFCITSEGLPMISHIMQPNI